MKTEVEALQRLEGSCVPTAGILWIQGWDRCATSQGPKESGWSLCNSPFYLVLILQAPSLRVDLQQYPHCSSVLLVRGWGAALLHTGQHAQFHWFLAFLILMGQPGISWKKTHFLPSWSQLAKPLGEAVGIKREPSGRRREGPYRAKGFLIRSWLTSQEFGDGEDDGLPPWNAT